MHCYAYVPPMAQLKAEGYVATPQTWTIQRLDASGTPIYYGGAECATPTFSEAQLAEIEAHGGKVIGDVLDYLEWLYEFGQVQPY
jgi:hypothetical protein